MQRRERTRVLSVLNSSFFGGPQNRNYRLAPVLQAMGVDTTVVLPPGPGETESMFRDAGIDTVTMPLHRPRETLSPIVQARFLLTMRREIDALSRLIAERSIDVVLVNGIENPHGAFAGRRAGAAVVWQLLSTRVPSFARCGLSPLVMAKADAVMSTGIQVARRHPGIQRLGDRLITFFPPVDTNQFRPPTTQQKSEARHMLGVPDHVFLVGMVGNLNPQKGHETFIQAAEILGQARTNTWFRILGAGGPTHTKYATRVRELVRKTSLVPAERLAIFDPGRSVANLVQAFDAFVLSSVPRSEGIPTTVLEAMAEGLPVVATNVGSVTEAVEHGVSGLIVPALQPSTMAGALAAIAADPALKARLGSEARAKALSHFSVQSCAHSHLIAFTTALHHAHSHSK